jgi:hypothetical protein
MWPEGPITAAKKPAIGEQPIIRVGATLIAIDTVTGFAPADIIA